MKRLYRSDCDKKIAGVCGGIGALFNIDPVIVRLLFILIALITGIFPMIITYIIAWIIIPTEAIAKSNTL